MPRKTRREAFLACVMPKGKLFLMPLEHREKRLTIERCAPHACGLGRLSKDRNARAKLVKVAAPLTMRFAAKTRL